MLAARARVVQRLARNFATADTAGIKVATFNNNQPTSSVTLFVKAGSRFESKAGAANALKNFAFKSTAKRSAIGTVRESELYGGVLSSSLGREHLAVTAEFLVQDAPFFTDVLTSFVTSPKFLQSEFTEYVAPLVDADTQSASHDPATRALEVAHALAFRHGLGQSLFAPPHSSLSLSDIRSFATSTLAKNNIAFLGTGIDQGTLTHLLNVGLDGSPSTSSIVTSPSKYFGGETRLESSGGGPQTVFIGYGIAGAPNPSTAVLASYLSPKPSVKWSKGLSPLSSLPEGSSAQIVHLPYSDATLFGVLIQGSTTSVVKEAGKMVVAALQATSTLRPEEFASAVAKAKFAAANAFESNKENLTNTFATKLLFGLDFPFNNALLPFDKLSSSDVTKTATTLFSSKPTYVVVGESSSLPYADELGL